MLNRRSVVLFLSMALALAGPLQSLVGAETQPVAKSDSSQVTASGTARVYRTPDYLEVVVGVQDMKPTASEAQASATSRMEAALVALKALKLEEVDFKTGTVELTARYNDHSRDGIEPKVLGYSAVNTMRVRTKDLKAAAKIIDTALKAGANRVDSVYFGLKEYLEAREEALTLAVKAAKRKAGVMVAALDSRLGRVVSVSEDASSRYGYWSSNYNAQTTGSMNDGEPAGQGEGAIEAGKVEVVVTVTLVCEIASKP